MQRLSEVVELVNKKFGASVNYELASNLLLIRIKGLDSYSLGKYIQETFSDFRVTTEKHRPHKFSDSEWIKVEYDYSRKTKKNSS